MRNLSQKYNVIELRKPLKKHIILIPNFHISFMLDDDKIGFVKQLNTQRNSLHQIGPTSLTQMYSPNATDHQSRNLDVETIPRDYWNNDNKNDR